MTNVDDRPLGSNYFLGEVVGAGSMGRVHRGTIVGDGSGVAVKMLREDLAADPDIVGKFIGESQLLRRISHPNVVGIRDLVAEGGQLGIVMDLVEGGSLRSILASRSLGIMEAIGLIAEVAEGLQAVHDAGIAHRDLKPENILCVVEEGRISPRITDFGISRLMSKARTSTSQLIGTPIYMAPELSYHRPSDATERHLQDLAADVYALGVVLFELLGGRPPYEADDPVALVMAHREASVPRLVGLPASVTALVMAMLDKDWQRRPAKPAAVALSLRASLHAATAETDFAGPVTVVAPEPAVAGRAATEAIDRREFSGALPLVQAATAPSKAGPRQRLALAATAGLLGLLAVAGGGWFGWSQISSEPEVLTAPRYAFVPIAVADGLVVNRTWILEGEEGDRLSAEVTITNSGPTTQTVDHLEVIPDDVAADVALVDFDPEPDEVIDGGRIVRFHVADLAPGADRVIRYSVSLPADGATVERIEDLAHAQILAESTYRAGAGEPAAQPLVASLELVGGPPAVSVGSSVPLQLVGADPDGYPVEPTLVSAVVWTSADVTVALVDRDGVLYGVGPGSTTISAQLGSATASMLVVVSGPAGETDGADGEVAADSTASDGGSDVNAQPTTSSAVTSPQTSPSTRVTATTMSATTATTATTQSQNTNSPAHPPSAPSGVSATAGSGQAVVSWNPSSENGSTVTGYEVQRSGGGVISVGAGATSANVTGLTNGQSYTFTVRATSVAGPSGWSSPSGPVVPSSVPSAPATPSASVSGTSAKITYSAPGSGGSAITGYELSSDVANGVRTDAGSPYTWSGLLAGTAHRFRVRACNANGCGSWSGYSNAVTPSTTPSAPATPNASAGIGQATISWSAPNNGGSGITGYQLTSDAAGGTKSDSASPYTWTGLSNGTTYRFRVRACNANGCGPWSAYSRGVTPAAPKVISLSRGAAINGGFWYSVALSGFSPGSSVTVACHDSIDSNFWTQSFTISGSGTASDSTLCWSADGPAHWVTGGGVTSNTVNW